MAEIIINIKEKIEKIIEEQFKTTGVTINFYGCSFNFGEGSAEATYHMGDD